MTSEPLMYAAVSNPMFDLQMSYSRVEPTLVVFVPADRES